MRSLQAQITPARAAVVAALATVAAGGAPPLVGLYVVTVAVAVMLGAAFAAYLSVVDEPGEWAAFEVAACAVAALLTLAGATLRYPTIAAGGAPAAAGRLAWLAFAVAAAAAAASVVRDHLDELWSLRDAGLGRVSRRT